VEQTRAARKAGPNRAAFGHAAKHLRAQQHRSHPRSRGQHGIPTPPLQADPFGPLTVPLAALLPELRRKGKQRRITSESRKDKRGYLFRLSGRRSFGQQGRTELHGNKGITLANRDARKYIEMHINTLDMFSLGHLNTTRVFFWISAI
jgi:hypothetical protein